MSAFVSDKIWNYWFWPRYVAWRDSHTFQHFAPTKKIVPSRINTCQHHHIAQHFTHVIPQILQELIEIRIFPSNIISSPSATTPSAPYSAPVSVWRQLMRGTHENEFPVLFRCSSLKAPAVAVLKVIDFPMRLRVFFRLVFLCSSYWIVRFCEFLWQSDFKLFCRWGRFIVDFFIGSKRKMQKIVAFWV